MVKNKEELFVQLNDPDKAMTAYTNALVDNEGLKRTTAGDVGRTFMDYDGSISVKSGYHRGDYEWFRAAETIPTKSKDIIFVCDKAYWRIGIVKNIIDLMSEFTVSGIRLEHPDKNIENFYNTWFTKVDGVGRSERFVNLLYRLGNVIVRRGLGTISIGDKVDWRKAKGKQEDEIIVQKPKVSNRQIPMKYAFYNPLNLEVSNPEWATITGEYEFELNISSYESGSDGKSIVIRGPKRNTSDYISKLPEDIRKAYQSGSRTTKLNNDTIRSFYYKKDDWQLWAKPMIYSVLADLIMYEKLKLADISALDGVISNVRLWSLGYINESAPLHSILPTKAGINRLRSILHNNVGGGTLDLVWGPELDFKESSTEAWRWLGAEKYGPTLDAIYDGLGIPPTLRSNNKSNNTGNYVGLQTLIERLEYGRQILLDFWYGEIKSVHKAMKFTTKPPKIIFDQMILADRAAERKLLMDLADRDIISSEAVNAAFGYHPEIETARVKREASKRGTMNPYKASPFHNPDKEHEYKKILLQAGTVSPSEVGVELEQKKDGEMNRFEQMLKFAPPSIGPKKYSPTGTPGRPKNVPETKKRKPKPKEKPSTKAEFINCLLWALDAQTIIDEIVNPAILNQAGKRNLRSLSKTEHEQGESVKFRILCNLKPYEKITPERVVEIGNNPGYYNEIIKSSKLLLDDFSIIQGRVPKLEEIRQIYASSYADYHEGVSE